MISFCVDPATVDAVWPYVEGFVASAFAEDRGDDDAPTVHRDLACGNSLLWIAWDGAEIVAAVTTKLISAPRGKICRITTCGGRKLDEWKDGLDAIERYAQDEGCNLMRFEGRKGFSRLFPDYRQPWIVLEKAL